MTAAQAIHPGGDTSRHRHGAAATLDLSVWLRLAATPTFAVMAVLTALSRSPMDRLCSSGPGAPLSGMALMYAIMSAFHASPWLTLIFGRRGAVAQS